MIAYEKLTEAGTTTKVFNIYEHMDSITLRNDEKEFLDDLKDRTSFSLSEMIRIHQIYNREVAALYPRER